MRRFRPSASMVVALLALVMAMGGTAIAARRYLITNVQQISPKVRHELRGKRGPRGVAGAPARFRTYNAGATVAPGTTTALTAGCASTRVIGGGYLPETPTAGLVALSDGPTRGNGWDPGWTVTLQNTTADPQTVNVYVVCTSS